MSRQRSLVRDLAHQVAFQFSSRRKVLLGPYFICAGYAILQFGTFMYGYGSYMHMGVWFTTFILILAALGAACVGGNLTEYVVRFKEVFLIAFLCVLTSFASYECGWQARLIYRSTLLGTASQIVVALDKYKLEHGSYPVNPQYLAGLSLPKNLHVYSGDFSNGEINWNVFDLGDSDITVLVEPKEYGVYIPVEKPMLMSFTSFAVYRYFSDKPKWVLGRIHWRFTSVSWSDN